jgi:hypothetical protein
MARSKVSAKEEVKVSDERQVRWEKFLDTYKAQNPVRFARLVDAGELTDTPPESFV